MKSAWIVRYLASDAVLLQEDKYALQQQRNITKLVCFQQAAVTMVKLGQQRSRFQ